MAKDDLVESLEYSNTTTLSVRAVTTTTPQSAVRNNSKAVVVLVLAATTNWTGGGIGNIRWPKWQRNNPRSSYLIILY